MVNVSCIGGVVHCSPELVVASRHEGTLVLFSPPGRDGEVLLHPGMLDLPRQTSFAGAE